MKRIRNSVKAIIVCALIVVIALGIVVGVVLTNRDKGNNQNPFVPGGNNNPPESTTAVSQLVADINSANKETEVEFYDEVAYDLLSDLGCNYDTIKIYGNDYFIYTNATLDGQMRDRFVVYKKQLDGSYKFFDLTNFEDEMSLDGSPFKNYGNGFVKSGAKSYEIDAYDEKYVAIKSVIKDSDGGEGDSLEYPDYNYSVIYFGDDVPVEVLNFSTNETFGVIDEHLNFVSNILYFNTYKIDGNLDFPIMDYSNISFSYDNYIFKLSNQATDIDDYIYKSSYNTSDFGEDSDEFVFRVYDNVAFENYKNKIKILPLNKNSTEIHEFELYDDTETCDVYFNKISKNKILVEKKKEVENNDANNSSIVLEGGEYYEYSYFVIDFSGEQPIKNNVDIKDGYTKVYSVEIGQNGDSVESYFLRQEKVNATLSTSNSAQYVYQYFDKDNKLIFEYESNSSEEILKSDGVNFLTNKRIFNLTTGNIVVSKVLFEDLGISVQNAEYQENVFLYSKNGSYGLMNLDGTMLSSDNNNDDATILFSKIYPEKEGFAICKNNYYDHDEYYIVNLSTGERKLIDNMYYDQNMEKLLEFGSGIYFTKDQVKGTLLLYENETLKFSNIQSYKFSTKMKNAALVEFYVSQSGNIDYLVKISGTGIDLSLNNDLNQYNVVGYEIKPYSITSIVIKDSDGHERGKGSAWDNDYGFLGTDHDYKFTFDVNEGYYIEDLTVKVDFKIVGTDQHFRIKTRAYCSSGNTYITDNGTILANDKDESKTNSDYQKMQFPGNNDSGTSENVCNKSYSLVLFGQGNYTVGIPGGARFDEESYSGSIKKITYSLSFGGSDWNKSGWDSRTLEYKTAYKITGTPTRAGFSFAGWTLDGEDLDAEGTISSDKIIKDLTVIPRWNPNTYTVVIDLGSPAGEVYYDNNNGGRIGDTDVNVDNGSYTATYTVDFTINHPKCAGYIFVGWTINNMQGAASFNNYSGGNEIYKYYPDLPSNGVYFDYCNMTNQLSNNSNNFPFRPASNGVQFYNIKATTFSNLDYYDRDSHVTFVAQWIPIVYNLKVRFGNVSSTYIEGNYAPSIFESSPLKKVTIKPGSDTAGFIKNYNSLWSKVDDNLVLQYSITYGQRYLTENIFTFIYYDLLPIDSVSVASENYLLSGYCISSSYYCFKLNGLLYEQDSGYTFEKFAKEHNDESETQNIDIEALYEIKDYYVGLFSNYAKGASKIDTDDNNSLYYNSDTDVYFSPESSGFFRSNGLSSPTERDTKLNQYISSGTSYTLASNILSNNKYNYDKFYTSESYSNYNSILRMVNIGTGNKNGITLNYLIDTDVSKYFDYKQIIIYDYPVYNGSSYKLYDIVCPLITADGESYTWGNPTFYSISLTDSQRTRGSSSSADPNEVTITNSSNTLNIKNKIIDANELIITVKNSTMTLTIQNCSYGSDIVGDNNENTYYKRFSAETVGTSTAGFGFNVFIDVEAKNAKPTTVNRGSDQSLNDSETWYVTNAVQYNISNGSQQAIYLLVWLGGNLYRINSPVSVTTAPESGEYTVDGKKIYFQKDTLSQGNTKYYIFYHASDFGNYVNINNTEINILNPKQNRVNASSTPKSVSNSNPTQYELETYLSNISFSNGKNIDLTLLRDLNNNFDSSGRSKLSLTLNDNSIMKDVGTEKKTINFFKDSASTIKSPLTEGYVQFEWLNNFVYEFNGRKYTIYLVYNVSTNEILYFVFSDSNDNMNISNTITYTFSRFDKIANISVHDTGSGNDYYNSSDTGADLYYSKDAAIGNNKLGLSAHSATVNGINPYNLNILKIVPQSGYLIYNVDVRIGSSSLLTMKLNSLGLQYEEQGGGHFTYVRTNSGSGSTNTVVSGITYSISNKEGYYFSGSIPGANSTYFGLFTSDVDSNQWAISNSAFESLYIMFAGIYENIYIDVQTVSYTEFDVSFDQNETELKDLFIGKSNGTNLVDGNLMSSDNQKLLSFSENNNNRYSYVRTNLGLSLSDLKTMAPVFSNTKYMRFVFMGVADLFKTEQVQIYASGKDNALAFSTFKYYGRNSGATTNIAVDKGLLKNPVYRESNYLYFEIDSLNALFNNAPQENSIILAKKYLFAIGSQKYNSDIRTTTYLWNKNATENGIYAIKGPGSDSGRIYQLDYINPQNNIYKTGSWFNDTVLSNIYMKGYAAARTSMFTMNWQRTSSYGNGIMDLTNFTRTVDGYGLSYNYNEVPGYWLQYVNINADGNEFNINIASAVHSLGTISGNDITYSMKLSTNDGKTLYVKIIYHGHNTKASSSYDIQFCRTEGDNSANINDTSLLVLQYKNIDVKFFSMPYNIVLSYNQNGDASNVTSYGTASIPQTGQYADTYYDDINTTIQSEATMTGYTLLGWGSKDYYSGENAVNRYSYSAEYGNVWNSSSSYRAVGSIFNPDNRNALYNDRFYSFAYYPVGARFVTDTGYGTSTLGVVENYNFWFNYIQIFRDTYFEQLNSTAHRNRYFVIDLYAIWKANTYLVKLDFNDYGSGNGSTLAQMSLTDRILNNKTEYYSDFARINNNSLSIGYDNGNEVFFAFITFDTKNWFITKQYSDNTAFKNSFYNVKNVMQYNFISQNDDYENLLDFVLDRYGYTWLGWFDEAFSYSAGRKNMASTISASAVRNQTEFRDAVIFGSKYSQEPQDSMPVLNYNRLTRFTKANNKFNDNINNKVYYNNRSNLTTPSSNKNYYFYDYGNKSDGTTTLNAGGYTYVKTYDYLNNNYSDVKYFDTMLNASAYNSAGLLNITESNYRYITLVANWQINQYKLVFDFADRDSTSNYTRYGSSLVTNRGVTDAAVTYDFDDETLSRFLMGVNPTRVGYDFMGWAFRYNTTGSDISNGTVYNYANTYMLNNGLLNFYLQYGAGYVLYMLDNGEKKQWDLDVHDSIEYFRYDVPSNVGQVFLTAVWRAQEFKVNISVDADDLYNDLEKDSAFALGFYNYLLGSSNEKIIDYSKYIGIALDNLSYDNDIGEFNNRLVNINYTLYFDKSLDKSVIQINYNDTNYTFNLADMFAVSSGYDFLGWLFASHYADSEGSDVAISNSKNTMFNNDTTSFGILSDVSGSVSTGADITFDYTLYTRLTNIKYGQDREYKVIDVETPADKSGDYVVTSSSFGKVDGHLLYCEDVVGITTTHILYYKDNDGVKNYVVLVAAGSDGSMTVIDNDHTTLRLNGNIINFNENTSKIYYVSNGKVTNVEIHAKVYKTTGTVPSKELIMSEGVQSDDFVPFATREFTVYASWKIRQFEADIENMNNVGENMMSNPGLAGYYDITATEQTSEEVSESVSPMTDGENEKNVSINFHTYDDLNIDILPYFNGRYLSKMTFTFYVIEQNSESVSGLFANYTKTKYTVTIKFSWNSATNNIDTTETSVSISPGNFVYNLSRSNGNTGSDSFGDYAKLNIVSSGNNWGKLSLLDRDINGEFIKIYKYYTGSGKETAKESRVDYNKLNFNLNDVMSDIEIDCTFSVQTFDVNVYNIIDVEKDNLISMGGDSKDYETPYTTTTLPTVISQNAFGNGGAYRSYSQFNSTYMATIPVDCAEPVTATTSYNVPYGYFIYGWGSYTTNLNSERPTGENHADNVDQKFGGYKYIYTYGYYEMGTTGNKLVGKTENGVDDFDMQSAGILGDKVTFTESLRVVMNFCEFKGYYKANVDEKNHRDIIFRDYDEYQNDYINSDIEIYGYYFASNRPTDMIFYVWDDAMGYIPYSENSTEYRSNYRTESSAFTTELIEGRSVLLKQPDQVSYIVDSDNIAMVKYFVQFGVNGTKFMNDDVFTLQDIPRNAFSNTLLEYITRTYWVYSQSYYAYYWLDNGVKHYIYYDNAYNSSDGSQCHGFYITEDGETDGRRKYVEVFSSYTPSADSQSIEGLNIDLDGQVYRLDYDVKYDYNFTGADMYAYTMYDASNLDPVVNNQTDYVKYYKIKELNDAALDELYGDIWPEVFNGERDGVWPRYYTQIEGEILFLVVPNSGNNNVSNFYRLNGNNFERFTQFNINITTLNNFYVHKGNEYYEIAYESRADGHGSQFINPMLMTNSVTVDGYRYFFNFDNRRLYRDSMLSDPINDLDLQVYCAVNENYKILFEYDDVQAKWIIDGVAITKLLSPHMSAWLGLDRYTFVGYIQLEDDDLNFLKSSSVGPVDLEHQRIMDVFEQMLQGDPYAEAKRSAIQERLDEFELSDLLSTLLQVADYNFNDVDNNLESIKVRITVTLHGVTWNEGEEQKTDDMTAIVYYTFPIVKLATTVLSESVYAIPIYDRNIMEFNNNSVQATGSELSIDSETMDLKHLEAESNRIHIYDSDVGDYVQYAVLSTTEFEAMKTTNKDNFADFLNKNLSTLRADGRLFDNLSTTKTTIQMSDFAKEGETYYLIAFYYKFGTLVAKSVNRVSDNCVEIMYEGGQATVNNWNVSTYR